jgi:pyruvate/2-oxoglutarate dehydrogenase complex dihydrolipoamide dehydrogenase (E3) component
MDASDLASGSVFFPAHCAAVKPTMRVLSRAGVVYASVNDSRGDRAIEGTDLLVATGRKANGDGIGLDKAGVQLDERG